MASIVPSRRFPDWLPLVMVAFVALAASISGISNGWVQDDGGIILKNARVHDLWHSWKLFGQPYWPESTAELYRPLALVSFAIQWAIGNGSPLVFRIVSYLLYAGACIQVLRVARLRLTLPVALIIAALFAAHPVHVEAVAMAVNQGELWVALLSCLAVVRYVGARNGSAPFTLRTEFGISGLFLVACFFKENALMLPPLLLAAELLLVRSGESWRLRIGRIWRLFALLGLGAVSFWTIRTLVLGGDVVGSFTAEGLRHLSMPERALTMLAVVPHWFRLLFWPARLQGDYSPAEIVSQTAWGLDQTLGLALLALTGLAIVVCWKRVPVVSFGLAWFFITLFPVHNVLVPTGIVLAERTLFLPSAGMLLALGGLGDLLLGSSRGRALPALAAAAGLLVILGVYRSTIRHPVWADQFGFWYQTAIRDAPRSYWAHQALAELYWDAGMEETGEAEFRTAMALSPPWLTRPAVVYANRLRLTGRCPQAAGLYRQALQVQPGALHVRASLIACLMHLGQYGEALDLAQVGEGWWEKVRATADSALRVNAPPGTVAIPPPGDSTRLTDIGTGPP